MNDLVNDDLKRIERLYKIKGKLNYQSIMPPLPPFYVINIYRIIQEFIQNSIKHGHPSEISINFSFENKFLYLNCKDDGIGFDMNLVSFGNGLRNIKQRAFDLSGDLNWYSEANEGTTLEVKIPVQ